MKVVNCAHSIRGTGERWRGHKPSKRGAELEGKTALFPQEVSKVAQ